MFDLKGGTMLKKLGLLMLVLLVASIFAAGALTYIGTTTEVEGTYTYFVHDTITFHVKNGIKRFTFSPPIYNLKIKMVAGSLHGHGTDSAYCDVYSQAWKGIIHNDTLGFNWWPVTLGATMELDSVIFNCKTLWVEIDPKVGGDHDSIFKLDWKGYR